MSLHPNTVREHLTALEADRLVRRTRTEPVGRGRPAWLYSATRATTSAGAGEYAGLVATLVAALRRHSRRPVQDAVLAGREWGRDLARSAKAPGQGGVSRRTAVVELLDGLHFAPESDPQARAVRLTRCPMLDAAERDPDVVCGVHAGIVEGALRHWGDTTTGVWLEPFAEPGACLLRLSAPGAGERESAGGRS